MTLTNERLKKLFVEMLNDGVRDEQAFAQCLKAANAPVELGVALMELRKKWYADKGVKPPKFDENQVV